MRTVKNEAITADLFLEGLARMVSPQRGFKRGHGGHKRQR